MLFRSIYIDHKNTYSASYSDFENLYLNFKLSNTNSVSTQLVLSVEYEDGSIVNKAYQATAYASELYMFIREVK